MRTGKATQHTCGGPVFGHRTPGCPRCDELAAGAPARQQPWRSRETRAQEDARRAAEIRAHRCGPSCGTVCTFGEW